MAGTGLLEEIKETFRKGSMLTRLIYINLGVYLVVKIIDVISYLFGFHGDNILVQWMAVPADIHQLLLQPWSIITYMFLHQQFLHILFNLLWLFWFGKIFLEYLTGKQLLNVYLLGGLAGAALYILAFNIFPGFREVLPGSFALGASAAIIAIVIAISIYVPDYTIYLLFLGPVKLKYIALFTVIIDMVTIADGNAGGHIAHLGGALFGYLYIMQYKKGKDISKGFARFMEGFFGLFKKRSRMKVTYKRGETDIEYNARKQAAQHEIDAILEKIAKSGYESLSKQEKEILFSQSRKS